MDPHAILSKAFEDATINGQKATVITYGPSKYASYSKIARVMTVVFQNIKLVSSIRRVLRNSSDAHILVREFSNFCILALAIFIFSHRTRIVFNINHNLKNIEYRFPFALYILAKFGFTFLMLDGFGLKKYIPDSIEENILIHPFPCCLYSGFRSYNTDRNGQIKIGIVGDFREEKGSSAEIEKVIRDLANLKCFTICVGARFPSEIYLKFNDIDIQVTSTERLEEYHEFLNTLDMLLIFAKRKSYFSRHSGTIMDGVSHGVVVLAPAFPVFSSQLTIPVNVGVTYESSSAIKDVIMAAADQINFLRANLPDYIARRAVPLNLYTNHV